MSNYEMLNNGATICDGMESNAPRIDNGIEMSVPRTDPRSSSINIHLLCQFNLLINFRTLKCVRKILKLLTLF